MRKNYTVIDSLFLPANKFLPDDVVQPKTPDLRMVTILQLNHYPQTDRAIHSSGLRLASMVGISSETVG